MHDLVALRFARHYRPDVFSTGTRLIRKMRHLPKARRRSEVASLTNRGTLTWAEAISSGNRRRLMDVLEWFYELPDIVEEDEDRVDCSDSVRGTGTHSTLSPKRSK